MTDAQHKLRRLMLLRFYSTMLRREFDAHTKLYHALEHRLRDWPEIQEAVGYAIAEATYKRRLRVLWNWNS